MNMAPWFYALYTMLGMGVLTWLVSLYIRDVSIVDSLWSLMFLAAACIYFYTGSGPDARTILLLSLVAAWALRLSLFLTIRNWGESEDRRYQEIRANNEPFWIRSLYIVFGLQAVLAWFISVPLLAAMQAGNEIGLVAITATVLWLAGFLFETVADVQLYSFRKNAANRGRVLDSGLWRYSRHPNYFGEALIWWAFYLFAVESGPWWIIAAPLLMTTLLLRVSGVTLMEKEITVRRPAYADYIRRTNAFLPWFPGDREVDDPHACKRNLGAS